MTYEETSNKALAIKQEGRDRSESSRDSHKRSCPDVAHGSHQGRIIDGFRAEGPPNYKAFKATRQLIMLIVEDPLGIRGIPTELLILALHVGKRHFGPCRQGFQGVTSVVRQGILQGIVLCHTLSLLLVEHHHQQFREDMLVVQGVEDLAILSEMVEDQVAEVRSKLIQGKLVFLL